jgi:hypothetical protein
MAKKISALAAASAVNDADIFPFVQGGVTKKVSASALKKYVANNQFLPEGKYSPILFTKNHGYANRKPDNSRDVPLHDASAGANPNFPTARKASIAIVSVDGTVNGQTVTRGDILQANRHNPTTAEHWNIIRDSSAEFTAAVEAAQGSPIELNGTYLINDANPDAAVYITGNAYIFYNLNSTFLFQTVNDTYAATNTIQVQCTALAMGNYIEEQTGTGLQRASRFAVSPADAAKFSLNQMMIAVANVATPNTAASSSKSWLREPFRIQAIDLVAGYIYADKKLAWHDEIDDATLIYINSINTDRAVVVTGNITLGGAPSFVGESLGWWMTLNGDQVAATITGNSGSSRTITKANHRMKVGEYIQVGTVSGTLNTSCKITGVTTDTITFTVPTTEDWNDVPFSLGTSGTLYYRPAFVTTSSTTLGGALIAEHANGSHITIKTNKLWASGVRIRHSNYCTVNLESANANNPRTQNDNAVTGRLVYPSECYGGGENVFYLKGSGGRHIFTDNSASTSTAFNQARWFDLMGLSINVRVFIDGEEGADGGPADTHDGSRGAYIKAYVHNPSRQNSQASYQGFYGNVRGANENRLGSQKGGYEGLVFRKIPGPVNNVHKIDLKFSDMPWGNSNTMAVRAETLAAVTNKPKVIGKLDVKNCGRGFKIENGWDFNLEEFTHKDVAYAAGYVLSTAKFQASVMNLSYAANTTGLTTRFGFLMDDTAEFNFGVMNVTLGTAANPAELFTDNDGDAGKKVTIGVLNITAPTGVAMPNILEAGAEGNFTLKVGMVIFNGEVQNISTLTTKGDLLVRTATALARLPAGNPGNILTPNANDNEGLVWVPGRTPNIKSGRILTTPVGNSIAQNNIAADGIYFGLFYVHKRMSFSDFMFSVFTTTGGSFKVGLYPCAANTADVENRPTGVPLATGLVGPITTASTQAPQSVAMPLTLDPGYYWGAVLPNTLSSVNCSSTTAYGQILGAGNMTTHGGRISYTAAGLYAAGLPDLTGVPLTYTEGSTNPYLGLMIV